MDTIFRPYRPSDAERSDRSAGDRLRHRRKVRESIRDNLADIIAEESIIGKDRDRVIKVPLRGIKEYRFIFGDTEPGVAQGSGGSRQGQSVGKGKGKGQAVGEKGGDRPGHDYYEMDVTLEELIDLMFEDLKLPEMERSALRRIEAERLSKRKGHRSAGVRVRLDKRRTVRAKLRRELASRRRGEETRLPFHNSDLTYRHRTTDIRYESNAVVLCIMDTSGSMDTMKKYLARSFFFLLFQFVSARYQNVEVVFIAHHTKAREVTEEEFFSKGESGGTLISSGYLKALEIIQERYHPSLWNIYTFHCSDGDNFDSDNDAALRAASELCEVGNLFGYGEIKPLGLRYHESSMLHVFNRLTAENHQRALIERKEDIWPVFKSLLSKDRDRGTEMGR